jgi:SAM-dependent methyltransferase
MNFETVKEALVCSVCGFKTVKAVDFPGLPLTGIYSRTGQDRNFKTYDQRLLFCERCGHAQLGNIIDASVLYGNEYVFRTSSSQTASKGSDYFADYLERVFPGKSFEMIVDFGCNDGYLLKNLKKKAKKLVGIDLIWKGRESEFVDDKIKIRGERIENIDFHAEFGGIPDLIVSEHTMEHIERPKELMESLFSIADSETVFVFEFPCFDVLLEQFRFDQVFHQHIQYFSVQSFMTLLGNLNAQVIDFTINYSYWGALIVTFKRGATGTNTIDKSALGNYPSKNMGEIRRRYDFFRQQMQAVKYAMDSLREEKWYGYGAALMLPVLGYHLQTDFSGFQYILDDDPAKDGLGYINLPVTIRQPREIDLSDACILLTALDNRRPVMRRLAEKKIKRILNPLVFM